MKKYHIACLTITFANFWLISLVDANSSLTIKGIVYDTITKEKIVNASVSFAGNVARYDAVTDSDGFFSVPLERRIKKGNVLRIRIEKIGYVTYDSKIIASDEMILQINLKPNLNNSYLRLSYIYCTGGYNIKNIKFEKLNITNQENFIIKNDILKLSQEFSEDNGGTEAYFRVSDDMIENLVGFDKLDSVDLSNHEIKMHRAKHKLEKYQNFFSDNPFDLNTAKKFNFLPDNYKKILKYNPSYNDTFDLYITTPNLFDLCGNIDIRPDLYVYVFLRSMRIVLVQIENISTKLLSNISIHTKSYIPRNRYEIRKAKDIIKSSLNMNKDDIRFCLNILKPGEKILLPLMIKFVPHAYSSGEIYESIFQKNKYLELKDSFKLKDNLLKLDKEHILKSISKITQNYTLNNPKAKQNILNYFNKLFSNNFDYESYISDNSYKIIQISFAQDTDPHEFGPSIQFEYVSYQVDKIFQRTIRKQFDIFK